MEGNVLVLMSGSDRCLLGYNRFADVPVMYSLFL